MDYSGEVFRNTTVKIDGHTLKDCRFENVVLEYWGGDLVFVGCQFDGFRFLLDGPLGGGLEALRSFHHHAGPKAVKGLVDGISSYLREPNPPQTFTIG